jgi:hypothetical protein
MSKKERKKETRNTGASRKGSPEQEQRAVVGGERREVSVGDQPTHDTQIEVLQVVYEQQERLRRWNDRRRKKQTDRHRQRNR